MEEEISEEQKRRAAMAWANDEMSKTFDAMGLIEKHLPLVCIQTDASMNFYRGYIAGIRALLDKIE